MPDMDIEEKASWLNSVITSENYSLGEISVIFCSDEYLYNINVEYLNHDYYTDVITFDYTENTIVSGDVFISVDRVRENSEQLGVEFGLELKRIMVHGVLHLLAYTDKLDKDRLNMTRLENKYLDD